MKYYFIFAVILLSTKIANFQQNDESLVPLNFVDAISKLNEHIIYQDNLNASKHVKILNEFKKHSFNSLFTEPLQNIFEKSDFEYESFRLKLNVSRKCSIQLNEFVLALRQEKTWALKGKN